MLETSIMRRVLFVCDYKYEVKDGLHMAVKRLGFDTYNLNSDNIPNFKDYDFILGHGAFGSRVDILLQNLDNKKGLCIGGNVTKYNNQNYDIFFYETEWVREFLNLPEDKSIHAFGINEEIFYPRNKIIPMGVSSYLFNYLSVGAFALWKNHNKIISKSGIRGVVGEIQKGNKEESYQIINELLSNGVIVIPQQSTEKLAILYANTKTVYVPANIYGGGERAVMEALAMGCLVEIEDNPKLQEVIDMGVLDSKYYASQLEKGINQCLKA